MEFTKIQGTGNDFIIIDNTKVGLPEYKLSSLAKRLCKRKFSIGADGLIVIEHATNNADFKMSCFNTDGSMAEMCGNGAICVARYAFENRIAWENMVIQTTAGDVQAWRLDKRTYKVKLNNPSIIELENMIYIDDVNYEYSYIELGNPGVPHAIILYKGLNDTSNSDIYDLARKIRGNKRFIKGTNVTFYDIINENVIIRTFERGVENFTLACGTAAGSTAFVISLKNLLSNKCINLLTEGGELKVQIDKNNKNIIENIYLIGDTNIVAIGKVIDEDL